jgi:hypothetical protein
VEIAVAALYLMRWREEEKTEEEEEEEEEEAGAYKMDYGRLSNSFLKPLL